MGCTERQTLPIPFGHHVYVVSDLSLSPTTDENSRPVRELIGLLGDIDDAAVVVVAGNLFHPEPTSDLVRVHRRDAGGAAVPARPDRRLHLRRTTPLHRPARERRPRTAAQSRGRRTSRAPGRLVGQRPDPPRRHGRRGARPRGRGGPLHHRHQARGPQRPRRRRPTRGPARAAALRRLAGALPATRRLGLVPGHHLVGVRRLDVAQRDLLPLHAITTSTCTRPTPAVSGATSCSTSSSWPWSRPWSSPAPASSCVAASTATRVGPHRPN